MTITRQHWTEDRVAHARSLFRSHVPVTDIANALETSVGAVYRVLRPGFVAFSPRQNGQLKGTRDASGQRRFEAIKATGQARHQLSADHPAAVAGTSIMPSRVFHASTLPRVLKSGMNSRKTGRLVTKGRWRGMPIYTLTLEERRTCPRDCLEWLTCYGGNMPYAQRVIADEVFEHRLAAELSALQAEYPGGFVVRLHILGDFYATDYVDLWEGAMIAFPALRVFGYTARRPDSEIGVRLLSLTERQWGRFAIRFSGLDLDTLGSVVVASAEDTRHLVCPAQTGRVGCCAECALCWQSKRTIAFLRH